jgi:hypothetical protein
MANVNVYKNPMSSDEIKLNIIFYLQMKCLYHYSSYNFQTQPSTFSNHIITCLFKIITLQTMDHTQHRAAAYYEQGQGRQGFIMWIMRIT